MDTYLLGDSPLTSSSTERSIDSSDRICLPPSINSVSLHEQEETTYQDNNPLTINKSHVVSSSHIHHQKVQKPIHNKVINTAIHDMYIINDCNNRIGLLVPHNLLSCIQHLN